MWKKCVRRTKYVRVALIIAIAVVGASSRNTAAHTNDLSALPRLTLKSLQYLGGFRLPRASANGDSFAFGGKAIAFRAATQSLFVTSRANRVAEVTIPAPKITSNAAEMPFASYMQPFVDPTEGRLAQVGAGVSIDGLMVHGDRLIGTANIFYDALNAQRVSHFSRSLQLNEPSFSGWSQVWDTGKAGFVSGFMSPVPAEWRTALGGPAATGQCCIPIVQRTSWGPAAVTFDPSHVGSASVGASPLLYYTGANPTLGAWSGQNKTYGATTMIGGMAMIGGTRTALYIGRNGTGPYCYGNGTSDPSKDGKPSPDGSHYCYDPTSSDKGTHAYPYNFQIWAYDLNDLAGVRAGTKKPWEVVPYGVWPFELPTYEMRVRLGGVAYDVKTQRLYVSQLFADKDGYESRPIIHVFQLDLPPAPVPVTEVTLTADKASPQYTNTSVRLSAVTTDGVAPFQYKWALSKDGKTWTKASDWSDANTFAWTPTAADHNYRVGVWARSAWNSDDAGEASAAMPFVIDDVPPPPPAPVPVKVAPVTKVTAVAVSTSQAAPVATGTIMRWTAAATGGGAGVQFKWLVNNGYNWIIYKDWSTDPFFDYQPGIAGTNKISAWARTEGSIKETAEVTTASASFPVVGPTMLTQLPLPQISNKHLAVLIGPDLPAPQAPGTKVTWTAFPVGGNSVPMFKWMIYEGYGWVAQGGWTTSPKFEWKPSTPNARYKVAVWVKNSTNTADAPEASTSFEYLIAK